MPTPLARSGLLAQPRYAAEMRARSTLGLTLLAARRWAPISAGLVVFVAATGACGLNLATTEDTAGQARGDSAAPLGDSAPQQRDSAVDPEGGGEAGGDAGDGGDGGATGPLVVQLASGLDRVCVVERVGSLKCWGRNDQGLSLIHISEPTRPY